MLKLRLVAATFGLFAAAPLLALAQETTTVTVKSGEATEVKKDDDQPEPKETSAVTKHVLTLDGQRIAYTATAGTLILRDDKGKAKASMFYVAYVKDGADAKRPVTFSFNGGPGSAAVWVQMGAFGPKKVRSDDEGFALPPPGELADNPYSILDITDLVFIDPIGTGFSRPAPGVDPKEFWGLKGDITSIADLMRQWLSKNGRWASPKYIAGESYGTTRSAGLALYLQERHGIYLNGVVQVSTDPQLAERGDRTSATTSPGSCTSRATRPRPGTTRSCRRTSGRTCEDAEGGRGVRARRVCAGAAPGRLARRGARQEIAAKVARYTGLSHRLRAALEPAGGQQPLPQGAAARRGQDGRPARQRFTGYDRDSAGEQTEYDPAGRRSASATWRCSTTTCGASSSTRPTCKYESSADLPSWNWDEAQNRYVNVAEDLRKAMTSNPALQGVCSPPATTTSRRPTSTHRFRWRTSACRSRCGRTSRSTYFEAGHMMYIRKAEHARLKAAIAKFIVH